METCTFQFYSDLLQHAAESPQKVKDSIDPYFLLTGCKQGSTSVMNPELIKEELANVYPHYLPKKVPHHKIKFYLPPEVNEMDQEQAVPEALEANLYARKIPSGGAP